MGIKIIKQEPKKFLIKVRVRKGAEDLRRREIFYGTLAKAEDRAHEIKKGLIEGEGSILTRPKVDCFHDVLELYREKSPAFSPQHKSRFNQLKRDIGEVKLTDLSDRLELYLKMLRNSPSTTGKPLSEASINRLMQMVFAALNKAVKTEAIDKNPISRARFPKSKEVARDKVLTPEERQRLLNVMGREAPHLMPIFIYAMQIPCRKSELINMRREDLDMINNAIRVRNGTTKNDQGLWKPIPPDMVEYFRNIATESQYLFYREENGAYYSLGDFKKSWTRCLRLAGVTGFRFHDTRHISASDLIDKGNTEQLVMQIAGWRTNMLRTYYHRTGKQAFAQINFGSGSGHILGTSVNQLGTGT